MSNQRPTVAAFDFDGTITRGGSVAAFLVKVRGPGAVAAALLEQAPAVARAAVVGGAAADNTKEKLFMRLLAGVPADEVERAGVAFAQEHLRRRLRPETGARIDWHRKQGHHVIVVSASPECYIRPAAELLGAQGALATRLAVSGSLLTGRYEGKNCRGAEKYARVMGWIRSQGLGGGQPVLWAYGNSRGDQRLLQAADFGIDAGRLGRFGRLRRFPRLAELEHRSGNAPAGRFTE